MQDDLAAPYVDFILNSFGLIFHRPKLIGDGHARLALKRQPFPVDLLSAQYAGYFLRIQVIIMRVDGDLSPIQQLHKRAHHAERPNGLGGRDDVLAKVDLAAPTIL